MELEEIYRLTDTTLRRASDLMRTNLDDAVRLQEDLLMRVGEHPRARMGVLLQLVVHKEWSERIQRGEPAHHAATIDHLFFRHARALLLDLEKTSEIVIAADPTDNDARACLTLARFCRGDRRSAEVMARSIPKTVAEGFWETVQFTPRFYDELRGFSDEDLTRDLPPVLDLATMPGDAKGIVYLSCNYAYFVAFALPMIMSLRDRSPTTPVHLHIMDASSEQAAFVSDMMQTLTPLTCAITIERPGLERAPALEARCYYHAVRFIRFYDHLKRYQSPLWLMDVDAIVNRDLTPLLAGLSGHDVAVRVRPARLEPWHQFNACIVGANATPASLEYFRLIAAYIAHFHQRKMLRWGIDQLAMYGVFADMQERGGAPSLSLLGEREVDYDLKDDGFVWPNSGKGKNAHLARVRKPGAPPPSLPLNRFDSVFERYWQETVQVAGAVGVTL